MEELSWTADPSWIGFAQLKSKLLIKNKILTYLFSENEIYSKKKRKSQKYINIYIYIYIYLSNQI